MGFGFKKQQHNLQMPSFLITNRRRNHTHSVYEQEFSLGPRLFFCQPGVQDLVCTCHICHHLPSVTQSLRRVIESHDESLRRVIELHDESLRRVIESHDESLRRVIELHDGAAHGCFGLLLLGTFSVFVCLSCLKQRFSDQLH